MRTVRQSSGCQDLSVLVQTTDAGRDESICTLELLMELLKLWIP